MLALLAREMFCLTTACGTNSFHEPSHATLALDMLRARIGEWVDSNSCERTLVGIWYSSAVQAPLAATAMLLINVIYVQEWAVGEPMILPGLARALPLLRLRVDALCRAGVWPGRELEKQVPEREVSLPELLKGEDLPDGALTQVNEFWQAFECDGDHSAWPPLRALLLRVMMDDGRHDACTAECASFRQTLVAALQNAWRVASPDGRTRPTRGPAREVEAPEQVLNPQLAPVFYTTEHREARGGLCGMQRFQFRQVLALVAAGGIAEQVQVVRNEGSLTARVCAAADLLKKSGERRAKKGYSALQTDSDHLGFGCDASKLIASSRQRKAYDDNSLICEPILARVSPPLSFARRWQGELISNLNKKRSLTADRSQPATGEERLAARVFAVATTSALADACRSRADGIAADMARGGAQGRR